MTKSEKNNGNVCFKLVLPCFTLFFASKEFRLEDLLFYLVAGTRAFPTLTWASRSKVYHWHTVFSFAHFVACEALRSQPGGHFEGSRGRPKPELKKNDQFFIGLAMVNLDHTGSSNLIG